MRTNRKGGTRRKWKAVSGCGRDPRSSNTAASHIIISNRVDDFEAFDKLPRALRDWLNRAPAKFSALEVASIYRRQGSIKRTLIVLAAHCKKRWPDFAPI